MHFSPGSSSSRLSLLLRTSVCHGLGCVLGTDRCLCSTGMHPSDECCGWEAVVSPGEVSLRHGRLVGCGLPSSNSMTGLVGLCTQQTYLRKSGFARIHVPIIGPASGHMRRTMSLGLEMVLRRKRKPMPEFRPPEEAFISHVSHFMDRFTWGLLPDFEVDDPYLNLDLWKDGRCLVFVRCPNISIFINVPNENRRALVLIYLGTKVLLDSWLIDLSGLET